MRLWSLHPRYLDARGLVALWREGLLARNVLENKTKGYRNHPQLNRFRRHEAPLMAIHFYLKEVHEEATRRLYRFDASKIDWNAQARKIEVTSGQLAFEYLHLRKKLMERDGLKLAALPPQGKVEVHPLFMVKEGPVEEWELVG